MDTRHHLEKVAEELGVIDRTLTEVGALLAGLQERKAEIERLIQELSGGG